MFRNLMNHLQNLFLENLGHRQLKSTIVIIREDNGTEVRMEKAIVWIIRMDICNTVLLTESYAS